MREVNYDERWKAARDLSCKINLWPTVENLQHIDAALRAAKVEGVREASEIADQVHTALWTPPQRACCSGTAAHIKALIDARAAQIEEGE